MLSPRRSRRSLISIFVALILVGAGLVAAQPPAPAAAVTASDMAKFDPGYIVSDDVFYDGTAASQSGIQAFLNAKVPTCDAGYTCLKSYRQTTTSRAADPMCKAYTGVANELASQIIAKVGQACGISPKVILVLLQKEQSLVTLTSPSAGRYRSATGFACPDTAACDAKYYGFYNQVYMAAWQYKRYGNPPGTSNYFTWIPVGAPSAIRYSPTASCGSKTVTVRNKATAALYYYTPYQPNAAALANPYGTGDGCSAYGNRNFWVYYTDWFGSTVATAPAFGNYEAMSWSGGALTLSGWAIDPAEATTSVSVRVDTTGPTGAKTSQTVVANGTRTDVGNAYGSIGAGNLHGFRATIAVPGSGQFTGCVTILATLYNSTSTRSLGCRNIFYAASIPGAPSVSRVSGDDRYETAAALSAAAYATPGVPVVFIATGNDFADALSAAPAAAALGGPMLLADRDAVPAVTLAELKRLAPKRIVVIGGTGAIGPTAYTALSKISSSISRVSGIDRYETSRRIAATFFTASAGAFVATGRLFPDALSASAAAGAGKNPVILVDGAARVLDPATQQYLRTKKFGAVTVVGGAGAVSSGIATGIVATGAAVTRLSGSDRYLTNSAVNTATARPSTTAYVATGTDFADAVAGAAVAGANKGPLLLVPGTCLPRPAGQNLAQVGAKKVLVIGGEGVVTKAAASLLPC